METIETGPVGFYVQRVLIACLGDTRGKEGVDARCAIIVAIEVDGTAATPEVVRDGMRGGCMLDAIGVVVDILQKL